MKHETSVKKDLRKALQQSLPAIWRFSYALSGKADTADDLTQATCLRALDRAGQVRDLARIEGWFLTICRSIWLNERRAMSIRQAQSLSVTPESEILAQTGDAESNILAGELFSFVMELPEAQREVVMLVLVEGHTYMETASIMEVPVGTVMSRLSAARAKLREKIDGTPGRAQQETRT